MKKLMTVVLLAATFCFVCCNNNPDKKKGQNTDQTEQVAEADEDGEEFEGDPENGWAGDGRGPIEVTKMTIYPEEEPDQKTFYDFTYDERGRLVKVVHSYSADEDFEVTEISYGEDGKTTVKDFFGRTLVYTKDGDELITAYVTQEDRDPYEITYNFEDGLLSTVENGNHSNSFNAKYEWNSEGSLRRVTDSFEDNTASIDTYSILSDFPCNTKVNIIDVLYTGEIGVASLFPGCGSDYYPTRINSVGQEDGDTVSADMTEFEYTRYEEEEAPYISRIRYSYGEEWRVYMIVDVTVEEL